MTNIPPIENEALHSEVLDNEENSQKRQHRPNRMKDILGGSWISNWVFAGNTLFLFFVTLLTITYIANRFAAEDTKRQIEVIKTELEELHTESVSVSAMLMETSRQSRVYRLVQDKELGLEMLKTPPYKIVILRPP